jgi:hypothetical protein
MLFAPAGLSSFRSAVSLGALAGALALAFAVPTPASAFGGGSAALIRGELGPGIFNADGGTSHATNPYTDECGYDQACQRQHRPKRKR